MATRYLRNIIRASRTRDITNYRIGVLVDDNVSSYFASSRRFTNTVGNIRFS